MSDRIQNEAIPMGVRLLLLVLVLSIWPLQTLALGVGQPQQSVYINRPLTLKLPLHGSVDDLLGATFQHASADEYKMLGLERAEAHGDLKFKTVINSNDSHLLVETSRPVSDLTLSFVVAVTGERTGRMLRDVHLLLDPPSRSGNATPANTKADQAVKSGSKSAEYGPVPEGSMLSSIAVSTKPRHVSVGKAIAMIYRANPEAFINGDIDRLKSGVMLRLPYLQVPVTTKKRQSSKVATVVETASQENMPKLAVQQPATAISYDAMGAGSGGQVRPSGSELELVTPSRGEGVNANSDFNTLVLAKLDKIESLNVALLDRIAKLESRVKSQADYIDKLRSVKPQAVAVVKPAKTEVVSSPVSAATETKKAARAHEPVKGPSEPARIIAANSVAANSVKANTITESQGREVTAGEEPTAVVSVEPVVEQTTLPEEATASGHWRMPSAESGGLLPWLVMGVIAFVLSFLFIYRYRELWLGGIRSAWAMVPSVELPEWKKGEWNNMVGGTMLRDRVAEAFSWDRTPNEVRQREEYADASVFQEPSANPLNDSAMPESEMATHLMRMDYPEHELPGQENDSLSITELDVPDDSEPITERGLYGDYGPEDSYQQDIEAEENNIQQRFEHSVDEDTEIVDFNLEEDGLIDELRSNYKEARVLEEQQDPISEFKSRDDETTVPEIIVPEAISEDELAEVGGFVDKVEESLKETEDLAEYPVAEDVEGDIAAIDEDSSGMLLDEHELTELLSYYKVNENQLRKQTDFVDDADNGYQLLLDLAASYIGTSDYDTARDLLHETMEYGTDEQQEIAKELLAELPDAEKKNSSKSEAGSLKLVG